jgi:hypothetical protein
VIRSASDGRQSTAIVFAVGDADTSLRPSPEGATGDGAGDGGIWIPDTVAAEIEVSAGDAVVLALEYAVPTPTDDPELAAATTVAGVYATSDGPPVSDDVEWSSLPGPLPRDPVAPGRTAQLLVTDAATATELIMAMGDTPFVKWDVAWTGPVSLEQGRVAAESTRDLSLRLQNSRSLIGQIVANAEAEPVVLSSGVGSFVLRA